MTGPCTCVDTSRTASASASDVMGKPASMMSTPSDDELLRHLQLLVDPERETGGLLAVAQGRVEDRQPVCRSS